MEFEKRIKEIERYITILKKDRDHLQAKLPHGMIRAIKNKKSYQYYLREKSSDNNGTYVPKKMKKTVVEYVRLEYDNRVLESLENELKELNSLVHFYENNLIAEEIYDSLPQGKACLIDPIKVSDKEFIETWMKMNTPESDYREETKIYTTVFGEKVRSKSEVLIAELYRKLEIPYLYEKPLNLKGFGIVRPDFTFLDIQRRTEIYHEHFGLIDDSEYRNNAIKKIQLYARNDIFIGDRLLITFETQKTPLDLEILETEIKHMLHNNNI